MAAVFECEIQSRVRDANIGGHLDSVEAMRVLDEARLLFFRHGTDGTDGLLVALPPAVRHLVGAHRVEYRAEVPPMGFRPFRLRLWVAAVGRSSFTVDYELRVAADEPPAIVGETSVVLFDRSAGAAWPLSGPVRATVEGYVNPPVRLRERA